MSTTHALCSTNVNIIACTLGRQAQSHQTRRRGSKPIFQRHVSCQWPIITSSFPLPVPETRRCCPQTLTAEVARLAGLELAESRLGAHVTSNGSSQRQQGGTVLTFLFPRHPFIKPVTGLLPFGRRCEIYIRKIPLRFAMDWHHFHDAVTSSTRAA